jgi:tetratricopeptide (TPR) repeat protein
LNYALLAGEQARQQFANQQAIEYYRRAKKLATEEPGRKEELWQATVGLGEIQVHIGEYDEAIHSYREALDSWPEAPLEERIKVMLRLGRAWNRRGDTEEAINWLFRASKELEELDLRLPALEGELYDELGWVIVRRGEFDRAEAWLQKGIAAVEEGNHPHLVASLHNHLGAVCFQKGELEQATEHVSRSLALREQLGDIVGVARSYNNLGILRRTSHDWEGALQSYQRGLELLERIGDTEGTIIAHTNIGNLFIERQEWDKAEENLLESLITAQCIRHGYELAQANMNLGRLYLLQEQLEAGAHHLHAALPLYEEAGGTTSSGLLDAHHWLSILHLKLDQLDEAQAWADRSHELLERLQGSSSSFLWGRYEQLLGQILMAEGKFAEAVKHLERSDEIYQSAAPVVDQGEIAYHLAQAYLALGRGRESDAQLERAQELYESVNAEAKIQEVESLRNEAQDRKRETEPRAAEA